MVEKLPRAEDDASPREDDIAHEGLEDLAGSDATAVPLLEPNDAETLLPDFGTYYPDEPHEYTPLER